MTTPSRSTRRAERAGRWLAGRYRVFVRQEERFVHWSTGKRIPLAVARGFTWLVQFVVVATLAYVAFWPALVVGVIWFCAWALHHGRGGEQDARPQWRNGLDGFGQYRGGVRVDPVDEPDD
ncbi:TPA: DUF3742 family protein [Pseudomonas aeruginosa]|uniref:DUF3742 family protein n=1 Tax=Pseudomonas aeruginosa TaxID=287 RepID=UPI000F5201E6|nr:DUF3742 family protein [Pseudomonas aeruginosa]RPM86121.1 hypothetical protein IPC1280_11600 [Pseudomonas aeruginosa]RPS07207.1 hypothetical protein IPC1020_09400 [Pseudomonas aeruginosa]HCE7024972.1 DUF3742 family protein [Pseudomonas aeruginosa]HCL3570484.1 DUF3742 family protein [Pseudomonas aeruginosa]